LKHKIYGHVAPKEDFLEQFLGTAVNFSTFINGPVRDDKFIGSLMTDGGLILI